MRLERNFMKLIKTKVFCAVFFTSMALMIMSNVVNAETNLPPKDSYYIALKNGGDVVCNSIKPILTGKAFSSITNQDILSAEFPYVYEVKQIYMKNCTSEELKQKIGFNKYLIHQLFLIGQQIANDGGLLKEQKKVGFSIMLNSHALMEYYFHWSHLSSQQ